VGIVTGEISNLVVLDFDPQHDGNASIERLERQIAPLPVTVEVTTGGGGRHLYFAHPGGLVRNRAGLAQGVDVRGDGGYIVAPPSVHPSGRR
jgi:Bifunctional DNA primase/polymerase, N-terminal